METVNDKLSTQSKTPEQTVVIKTELVLPSMANLMNNLQGGQMMHFMDIAGALSCRRHAGCEVATVAVEKIEFRYPVKVGEVIILTSKLTWVGRSSMKVKISVISENLKLGETKLTNVAYFTYVALGDDGRPVTVPRLSPETQEEQDAFDCEQRSHEQKMDCGCH
jgi:acyl-CoA hydrolase